MGVDVSPRLIWLDATTAGALNTLAASGGFSRADALRAAIARLPRLKYPDVIAILRAEQQVRGGPWQYFSWRRDGATVDYLVAEAGRTGLSQAAILRYAIRRAANGSQ